MSFDKESEGDMPTLHNFSIYAYLSSWQQMTSKIQLCLFLRPNTIASVNQQV